jgi:hypothetical protein
MIFLKETNEHIAKVKNWLERALRGNRNQNGLLASRFRESVIRNDDALWYYLHQY